MFPNAVAQRTAPASRRLPRGSVRGFRSVAAYVGTGLISRHPFSQVPAGGRAVAAATAAVDPQQSKARKVNQTPGLPSVNLDRGSV